MTDTSEFAPRRAVFYNPVHTGEPRLDMLVAQGTYTNGFLAYLLREDCRTSLAYGSGGFTPVVVSDSQDRATALITRALADDTYERPLGDTLRGFVATTAEALLRHPTAHYELVYSQPPTQTADDPPTDFRLLPVPSGTVRTRRGRSVQYVPVARATHRTRRGVGFIDLDPDTLATFRLDPGLERHVRSAFAALGRADAMTGVLGPDAHRAAIARSVTSATAAIGWNGRIEPLSKEQLWPYQVWRRLEFLAFRIKVRDAVLSCLNNALAQAGHRLRLPMSIELHDVLDLEQVRSAQDDLTTGRKSLNDLIRYSLQ